MIRQIIKIDEELCNGCELCVNACHEGAIQMVDGKAKLIRDDYCDGLGNCLPVCPTGAITFEEREAAEFDEKAVEENMKKNAPSQRFSCPSTTVKTMDNTNLMQWPVQIQLVPVNAPYFDGAHLLIAADCAGYAHASFNQTYMKNKITIIGCPKLDNADYQEKFTAILKTNNIKSVTIIRMEVPCCGGLTYAATQALQDSGKMIPWSVITLATDGSVIEE